MNTRNFGIAEGRLTRDPILLKNADGSLKVKLTVAVQDNYVGKDGKRGAQFIDLEAFVRAEKVESNVFALMHEGDLVCLHYTVKTNNYTDKDGKEVHSQTLLVQDVDRRESKSAVDARQARKSGEVPF